MEFYTVVGANPKGHRKQLSVSDGAKRNLYLVVPRFAPAGKGDVVAVDSEHPSNIFVVSSEDREDLIRLSPHFEKTVDLQLGSLPISARITEVNRPEDIDSLNFLEKFHYRSTPFQDEENDLFGNVKSISTGGRRAVLLIYLKSGHGWQAVGYIELQMPLMMVKPRHDLFNNAFSHRTRSIQWGVWDLQAMRKYLNLIVRVARVVINPEFRGLGLSRVLLTTAQEYCRQRWHLSGYRPLFLEISAEMLNYIDFVSSSKFLYVGHTEGNASRVVKDLSHIVKGYDITSGIMSLQKKYSTHIMNYCKETNKTYDEVLSRLSEILQMADPAGSLSPAEWAAFRTVIRMPRPYYLAALDEDGEQYLRRHLRGRSQPLRKANFQVAAAHLDIASIAIRSTTEIKPTRNVRMILDAFGLSGDRVTAQLLPPTPIKASAGNIILVAGVSGSGKSILLQALDPQSRRSDATFEVQLNGKRSYSAGWLRVLPDDTPTFDYFADRYSPEKAFASLSQVGLSEAFVLIKPFKLLSRGQQYRAMLADLLLREEQVWLLDEFCADLDPLTARIVAHNFRRHVISSGRIAIVAAANHGHFIDALRPTRVIYLKTGSDPQLLSYRDYRDEFLKQVI